MEKWQVGWVIFNPHNRLRDSRGCLSVSTSLRPSQRSLNVSPKQEKLARVVFDQNRMFLFRPIVIFGKNGVASLKSAKMPNISCFGQFCISQY